MSDPTPGPYRSVRNWPNGHRIIGPPKAVGAATTLASTAGRDPDVGDDEDAANGRLLAASWSMRAALRAQEAMEQYDNRSYDQAVMKLETFHAILKGLGWDGTGRDSDFVRGLRRAAIEQADGGEANT